ncbi:MAG: hypothetical protein AAFW70_29695 [Cyanobacteria bacterium J06635_10]
MFNIIFAKKTLGIYRFLLIIFSLVCFFSFQGCAFLIRKENFLNNGGSIKMEDQPIQSERELIIHGEVNHVNRLDIDKSGRNPKYKVSINLAPTKIEGAQIDLSTNSFIKFQGKEKEILEQIERLPVIGDHLIIESSTTEDQPRILPIKKIKFKDTP